MYIAAQKCIPMYTGYTLCTYSFPSPVFYLKLTFLYVNPHLTFFTHIHNITHLYIGVYRLYTRLFINFRKLKTPFQVRFFTATNPDLNLDFLCIFWPVYQCIHCVYSWYTTTCNFDFSTPKLLVSQPVRQFWGIYDSRRMFWAFMAQRVMREWNPKWTRIDVT